MRLRLGSGLWLCVTVLMDRHCLFRVEKKRKGPSPKGKSLCIYNCFFACLLGIFTSSVLRQLSHHNHSLRRAITYLSFARDSQAFRSEALPPPKDFFLS